MNMTEYDVRIAPVLDDITISSSWIRWYVDKLLAQVMYLPAVPEFKTKAESEMDKAIQVMEEGLAKLKEARGIYTKKEQR